MGTVKNLICVEDGIDMFKDAGEMISVLSAVRRRRIERENIPCPGIRKQWKVPDRKRERNGGFAPWLSAGKW